MLGLDDSPGLKEALKDLKEDLNQEPHSGRSVHSDGGMSGGGGTPRTSGGGLARSTSAKDFDSLFPMGGGLADSADFDMANFDPDFLFSDGFDASLPLAR
jgi:hypothetical protein